ncbi:efflux RND transporter periplasmic adaptor subunit [Methyloferula stellata]|uniref:efflux RND transporter periplasmic adaptor subunit n=1 Tax=Methyloferula stellata TaxID=876270 RepID=UPI00036A11A2|nr:efflux RND transporter periplasmic adaptor subunit [Methyloferula stellata]
MSLRDAANPNSRDGESGPSAKPAGGRGMIWLAASVAIALGVGFVLTHRERATAEAHLAETTRQDVAAPPTVDVVTANASSTAEPLSLPGETAAWYATTLYARVNGYVDKWLVDIGDRVHAGQVLATIDTPELDAELQAAKAKLNASEAQVQVRQARADFAKTTYDRWRDSPKGVVSDQDRESKKSESAEAVAELNAARAQVVLQQAEVDRLSALTEFKKVKAPFDGTIVQRHIDVGDLVTAGSTNSTSSLFRLTQDDPIRVFVNAPQSAAQELMQLGTPATITSSNRPDLRIEGKVTRTARAINPQARTLRVEVDISNPKGRLVSGMYVQVAFRLKSSGLIQVPAAALLFRSGGPQVAVVDDQNVVRFQSVSIARDNGNVVDIGSGLEMGDKVALNMSSQIVAGEKVQANEIDQEPKHAASAP